MKKTKKDKKLQLNTAKVRMLQQGLTQKQLEAIGGGLAAGGGCGGSDSGTTEPTLRGIC